MRKLTDRIAQEELARQDDRDLVSRSDRKRVRTSVEDAIAGLGEQIIQLSSRQIQSLELPEAVLDAVHDAQAISSPIARARQMRLVRRELRALDWEPIQDTLQEYLAHGFPARPKPGAVHQGGPVQAWVSALIAEGDAALQRLSQEAPAVDRKRLRMVLRSCQKADAGARAALEQKLTRIVSDALP